MPNKSAVVRKPTAAESAKMERARQRLQEAQREERDPINKLMPSMMKAARDQEKSAKAERESVPKEARDYEAMEAFSMPNTRDMEDEKPIKMKKGGMVIARGQGRVMKKRPTRIC